ncbi:hypothetical protein, conserved [Angomonas deanei]|uniref:Uncharacterized protein n=1 Tax=Angomonas deanei TaxID=59799 RepID=A0A7G2CDV2_9TRYP|nr:hypothetical protein, conserved [Angomonas deanei]
MSSSEDSFGDGITTNLTTLNLNAPTVFFPQPTAEEDAFFSDDDDDDAAAPGNQSSSDDDEWGTIRDAGHLVLDDMSDSSDGNEDLFIPEPIFTTEAIARCRPSMPYLSKEELPVNSLVWVVDEDDVRTLLRTHWDPSYDNVCNGKQSGHVMRHSGEMTLVKFENKVTGLTYCLSIPRICLSLKKVDTYDGAKRESEGKLISSGMGKLDGLDGNSHSNELCFQFYETLTALHVSAAVKALLSEVVDKVRLGLFEEALKLVEEILVGPHRQACLEEGLMLRSRILIFLQRYRSALADALEAAKVNPRWVKGYLTAARAYTCLGQFSEAGRYLVLTSTILPNSAEVESLKNLNEFMLSLQESVERISAVRLYLDENYKKHLLPSRKVVAGGTLITEGTPIVSSPPLGTPSASLAGLCCVCFSPERALPEDPLVSPELASLAFCSAMCRKKAGLFVHLENKYSVPLSGCVEVLLDSRSAFCSEKAVEVANLTLRLFFILASTHKRRAKCDNQSAPSIQDSVELLGIFPCVTSHLSSHLKDSLVKLYDTLSETFKVEDKKTFSVDLFLKLFCYVQAYILPLDISAPSGSRFTVHLLPKFVTCCTSLSSDPNVGASPNCAVEANLSRSAADAESDVNYLKLTALQTMDKDTPLFRK